MGDPAQQVPLLIVRVGHQGWGRMAAAAQQLGSDRSQIRLQFVRRPPLQMGIAEDLQIAEQRFVLRQFPEERGRPKGLAEARDIRHQAPLPVFVPGLAVLAAEQAGQRRVLARPVETDVIGFCQPVKIQKFVIGNNLRIVAARRNNALHLGAQRNRPEIAKHRYALVPLHHIVAVQILDGNNRLADALLQMGRREGGPFCRKLAVLVQQRVEGGRKSLLSGSTARADNLLDIDAHCAQTGLMQPAQMRDLFLQDGNIRFFVSGTADFYFLQADFTGLLIRKISHSFCPFALIFTVLL